MGCSTDDLLATRDPLSGDEGFKVICQAGSCVPVREGVWPERCGLLSNTGSPASVSLKREPEESSSPSEAAMVEV